MSAFVYELASVVAAVEKVHPNHPKGLYALPWYLVVGEPGTGRTTIIRSMNLSWPHGNGPLQIGAPQQLCTYWVPGEAVIIEPEPMVLGPARDPSKLKELCGELRRLRPREPIDGILLVLNIAAFVDLDDRGLEQYAAVLRSYLIEVGRELNAEVPLYITLTRYDTLWGFAEVFQWTPERKGEEAWGFVLPGDTHSQNAIKRINTDIDGLVARIEAFCLAKLCSEDPPELRTRAFQHLTEMRAMIAKLRVMLEVIARPNAYEQAPWVRAMIVGTAVPGTGDHLRAGVARFTNMGLSLPAGQEQAAQRAGRPGGLPMHSFFKAVVLPEKDLVPTRTRWRDDKLTTVSFLLGSALWLIAIVWMVAAAVATPR